MLFISGEMLHKMKVIFLDVDNRTISENNLKEVLLHVSSTIKCSLVIRLDGVPLVTKKVTFNRKLQ